MKNNQEGSKVKRSKKRMTLWLPPALGEAMRIASAKTRVPRSDMILRAIFHYYEMEALRSSLDRGRRIPAAVKLIEESLKKD